MIIVLKRCYKCLVIIISYLLFIECIHKCSNMHNFAPKYMHACAHAYVSVYYSLCYLTVYNSCMPCISKNCVSDILTLIAVISCRIHM